ncbi:MAG TPA: hypothetical protein VNL73_06225 [Verrucomicrobiae bacterium]|nr:hypothetical protein [Verrucomicrobiae bacterium]
MSISFRFLDRSNLALAVLLAVFFPISVVLGHYFPKNQRDSYKEKEKNVNFIWSIPPLNKDFLSRPSSAPISFQISTSKESREIRLENLQAIVSPNIQIHPNSSIPQSEMSITTVLLPFSQAA